jgi:hypothetical protein
MATLKKLTVGAINITIHPHTAEKYIEVIKKAGKNKTPVKLRKDLFGTLTNVKQFSDGAFKECKVQPVEGDLIKYVDINLQGNWWDIETKDVANDVDKEKINIPKNLKPNLEVLSFIFFPDEHLLIYESYETSNSLTPSYAEKIVRNALNSPDIVSKYGIINVKHHPETDAVDKLIELKKITNIQLETRRPNPDGLKSAERKVHDRLAKLNAKTEIKEYKADENEFLTPDIELTNEIKIAARNGEASLVNINENDRKELHSTKSHPLTRTDFYNPDIILLQHAFLELATKVKKHIVSWINDG